MSLKKDIIETEFRTSGANNLQNDIGKVEGNIKRLNSENERLRINKTKLEAQGKKNTIAWKHLNEQIKKNTAVVITEKQELSKLNSQLKISEMSSRQLTKQKRELARELNNTTQAADPARWKKLNATYNETTKQLTKVRAGGAGVNKMMGLMKQALPMVGIAALLGGLKRLGSEFLSLTKIIQGDAVRSAVVFGDELAYVKEESEKLARQMGFTNREFVAAAAATADLLIPLDFTRKQSALMSVELQTMAGALDEWTGGQFGAAEVSAILTKAMLGENEQLKQLGIAIRKDTDEFRDLVKQKIAATGATKIQAEAMATLELIQKKSADAQSAYTREGNKLLRMQKEMSVKVKNLKEGFIALFEVPVAKTLENERKQVSLLTVKLLDANTSYEDKVKILGQLKTINPDIVEGINAENIEYTKLNKNLLKYNENIVKRIVLANMQEEEEKNAAKVATQLERLGNAQLRIGELINERGMGELLQNYETWEERIEKIKDHLVEVVKKQKETGEAGSKSVVMAGSVGVTVDTRTDAQKQLEELTWGLIPEYNAALDKYDSKLAKQLDFSERIEAMKEVLGLTEELNEEEEEVVVTTDPEKLAKEKQEAYKKAIDDLKQMHQEEQNIEAQFRADELISQKEYEDNLLALKIANLNIEIEIRKQFNMDTSDLEGELLKIKVDFMNQEQAEKAKLSEQEKIAKEKAAAENKVLREKELAEMQADMQMKIDYANQLSTDVANTLTGSFNARKDSQKKYNNEVAALEKSRREGELSQEEFKEKLASLDTARRKEEVAEDENKGKAMLILALQYLKKYALAKIAEATIGSLASKESIATFGIAGVAKAAILSGLIGGALSIAEGAINRSGSSFDEGGHTGPGTKHQPAGIVHANEYVIPQEGYFNPNLRPFINMIESARQSGSLRSLNMSNTGLPGLAEGGPSTPNLSPARSPLDPAILELLKLNATYLGQLLKDGTFAKFGDEQVREIRDRTTIITNIENSTRS